ncbi:hypothetical protein JMJ35_002402 [Cladonia borealis]|uniref:Heterokaryon incompatibility domain-containing protein n=1 Tax=Cladonia borealis TaxID=184061 RepID=A0AA39V3T5_9LECA|nr:hypothetical protein JMJ35_002402 [Cladonia borealis]
MGRGPAVFRFDQEHSVWINAVADSGSVRPELEWASVIQQADKAITLLSSIRAVARDEEEYSEFILGCVRYLRRCLERAANERGVKQMDFDLSNLEDYRETAISFLVQLGSKLDPEGSYDQNGLVGLTPSWQLTSDDVTHFVLLADQLDHKWDHWWCSVHISDNRSPRLPCGLYIDKLESLRDRLFAAPKLSPWVDIAEIRRWLDHCDEYHSDHCRFSSRSDEIFVQHPRWLIDVHRLCLVQAEPGQQYVALSYVWGSGKSFRTLRQNLARLQQEGSLKGPSSFVADETSGDKVDSAVDDPLPKTIRDVIAFTRQLGEKFLWVDSLCIVQDDYEEKEEHLSCMGSIYANAYVTVAATGGTAFGGLRGVENLTPSMERTTGPRRYLRKLQASVWNHRAWTFQEQVFSRRLLVFGEKEVSWECHCTVWFEGMDVIEGQCQNNNEVVAQGLSFAVPAKLWDYACHVEQYNRRALTFPEDALDAFGGILTTLSTVFIGGFICGLPRMFFDAALLWYNKSPLERRRAVRDQTRAMPPTWAWAAWGGAISFRDHAKTPEIIKPLVRWNYRAHGQNQWQPIAPDHNQQSLVPQKTTDELEGCARAVTTQSDQGDGNDTGFATLRKFHSHLLFSQPLRSFFQIGEIYGSVQVLLRKSAGMLTSCEALSLKSRDQLCEVVAVSALSGKDVYNVLWIEWDNGIAHRKGVGWVTKSAWSGQKSEPIDLILE